MASASKPLLRLQLRNELDVVLAQQRARECAQLTGITGAAQTKFATAVSEICRNVIEHVGTGEITLGLRLPDTGGPSLEALIADRGRGLVVPEPGAAPLATGRGQGLYHARQLADEFELQSNPAGTRVTLRQRLPGRGPAPSDAVVEAWRAHLTRPVAVSPYEELKKQNDQLVALYEELQEKNHLAEQQIRVISQLNLELERLNATNLALLQERQTRNLALQLRNEELDAFAHTVSHDLKSPLENIDGLAQLIEYGLATDDSTDLAQSAQLLRQQAAWMSRLIHGILEYARAGRSELPRTPVNVAALVTDVVRSVRLPAGLTVHVSPGLPTLLTEEIYLQQVFSNLIGNAGKYHDRPATGNVWVAAHQRGETLEFSVADDGPGIRPEDLATLFQIFQVSTTRATVDSTGVGLAIVRKIVRDKGGEVRVESVGRGTRFVFSWPAQEVVPAAPSS